MDLITAIAIYFGIGVVFTLAVEGLNYCFVPEEIRETFTTAEQILFSIFWPLAACIFLKAIIDETKSQNQDEA